MKLSICMMVKNEERYLKQCLQSLQALHEAMETELIIVDTGSTDATVEIAQSYTDKVYHHDWFNDFSGMRNITLSYATGQWIFYIDGDEVVNDCKNIILFLTSKLSQEYNAAMVDIKNYVNIEKDNYSMLSAPRLFKRDNIRFEGMIHNQPVYKGPVIKLNEVVLLHYGYIANDQELMERKFQRTGHLLIKQLEKDPENIYYRYQLSVSYLMHRDMEEALTEAERVYRQVNKDMELAYKHLYVYAHMAKVYGLNARYQEVKQAAEQGLKINAEYVDLWFYLHHSSIVLEQYEDGIRAGLKYLELVENYASLAISKEAAIVMDNLNKSQIVIFGLAYAYIKLEKDKDALHYLGILDADFVIDPDFDVQVIKACFRIGQFQDLLLYTERFVISDNVRRVQLHLAAIEENRRQMLQEEPDKYLEFLEAFAQVEGSYGELNAIRLCYEKQGQELFNRLDAFIAAVNLNAMADYTADLLFIMLVSDYPLADVLTCIREENINVYFGYLLKNCTAFLPQVKVYLAQNLDIYTYSQVRSRKILAELLLENDPALTAEAYEHYFIQYRQNGAEFLRLLYNPIVIEYELINDLKNPEELALLYLLKAEQDAAGKPESALAYLEKARTAFAPLERGIDGAIAKIKQQQRQAQEELQDYKKQVKNNIENLIQLGKLDQAAAIIAEYNKLVPDDVEIYSMQAIVLMLQGKLSGAEEVLQKGLEMDPKNFDLLYNLANLYERSGNYHQALIYYRRACSEVFYDSTWKEELDTVMQNIREKHRQDLQAEAEKNELYAFTDEVKSVIILEHEFSGKSLPLAHLLNKLGIAVDLVYTGPKPDTLFPLQQLVYRKILMFYDIDRFSEYLQQYDYDLFYLFGLHALPQQFKKINSTIIFIQPGESITDYQHIIDGYKMNKRVGRNGERKTYPFSSNLGKSLSMVIPTYNRPHYLNRLLTYLQNYKQIKPAILVADSSSEEKKHLNGKVINDYQHLEVLHMEFNSDINIFHKIYCALEKVDTPYVCLCADDDFLTEEGLLASLAALKNNPKLFSVKGKNLYFIKSMANLWEYDPFSGLYEQDAFERLGHISKGFVPSLIYQVFRTDDFRKLYQFLYQNPDLIPANNTFSEYLFYFLVIMTGPIGRINIDLNIRDKGVPREIVIKNFPHALVDGTFNENYHTFKTAMREYACCLNINLNDFDQKVDTVFIAFLNNFLGVAPEMVILENDRFNLQSLEKGMRNSWVWPEDL